MIKRALKAFVRVSMPLEVPVRSGVDDAGPARGVSKVPLETLGAECIGHDGVDDHDAVGMLPRLGLAQTGVTVMCKLLPGNMPRHDTVWVWSDDSPERTSAEE
jgi:hypothetical protein